MRPRFYVALAIVGSLTVAGCAGTNVTPGPSLANRAFETTTSRLGSAVHRDAAALRVKPDNASYRKALYVGYTGGIKILTDTYYRELGAIHLYGYPTNLTMDQQGNLYAANGMYGYGVSEYPPGSTSPSFTYETKFYSTGVVAVDQHANVYVGGCCLYGYGNIINEYFQGDGGLDARCSAPEFPEGLAVDTSGDVFLSGSEGLYEYSGGLTKCNPTLLMSLQYMAPGNMVLDSNKNLIIADGETGGGAYVIAPPYSAVTRTIGGGYSETRNISLNKKNKLLFMAIPHSQTTPGYVLVYNYQTGALVKKIDAVYGILDADCVVDGPNAVY